MLKRLLIAAVVVGAVWSASPAHAVFPGMRVARSYSMPWHNAYYDPAWGEPVALVVPPTAEMQTQYGWGVGGTRVTPIYHQFGRPYPGSGYVGGPFQPTPYWPSDTTQFGVYYVRGPW